jgi:hypothetical protein
MVKKAGGGSVPKGAKGISDKRPEPSPRPTSASPKKVGKK